MKYETFNPEIHDTLKVSKLVYNVDFRTFDMLFKTKESAVKTIQKSFFGDDLENIKVITENGEVIGLLIYYISEFPNHFNLKSLRLLIVDILDYFVLSDVKEGDLYIAEIAIDEKKQGHGLGGGVLDDVVEYAKSKNLNRVTLDADFRNSGAKRLYEKKGFKVVNKKRVKILTFERGMYNMEMKLK